MDIKTLETFEEAIKTLGLLKKYNLDRIGVFGSFARGETANDIDLYVDSESHSVNDLIGLKNDLEQIAEREVDIMLKKYANPIVLFRAQKDMRYVTQ